MQQKVDTQLCYEDRYSHVSTDTRLLWRASEQHSDIYVWYTEGIYGQAAIIFFHCSTIRAVAMSAFSAMVSVGSPHSLQTSRSVW